MITVPTTEHNGRLGGVDHPEHGSKVDEGEAKAGPGAVRDSSKGGAPPAGGAERLQGADALGDTGGPDLGRGGD